MKNISQWLLNLFLQSPCPLCQRSGGEYFCRYCQQQLQSYQLKNCQEHWTGDLPLFTWGTYQGSVKQAIAALKYNNHPELARPLGNWMGKAWQQASPIKSKCIVVPIPMHSEKQKQRGFNQAELLAQSFCQITRHELRSQTLIRAKETKAQFSLSAAEREKNLQAAFQLGREGQQIKQLKQPVLLLDDIYTTGATARAAKEVLQRSGIKVAGIVALATTKKL
jgi:ComF family protein